jgi:glycosyltransferase involved in cell wall biosynthesis
MRIVSELSVVIPVFRAGATLDRLLPELTRELERLCERHEIILVEDSGGDDSWARIRIAAQNDPRIRGIRLSRNFGQHAALLCGIRKANFAITATLDDDMQHPPAELAPLLQGIVDGADLMYGIPQTPEHSVFRSLASKLSNHIILSNYAGGYTDIEAFSAFRVFRTALREGFREAHGSNLSLDVLLAWTTSKARSVRVTFGQRFSGTSNYTLAMLLRHAFNMFAGFSSAPLRLASAFGFGFSLFGFGLLAWVVMNYFVNRGSIPGFTFMASIVSLFSGIQLLVLGLMGEYISRIYLRSMRQPSYLAAEDTSQPSASSNPAHADSVAALRI